MLKVATPARAITTANTNDHLHGLVGRIAAGDRAAFRRLYALLALPIWRDAIRALPRPLDARAVMRSTLVEVWHMARHHLDETGVDSRTWIAAITARRANDRRRGPDTTCPLRDDHDGHTVRELTALLGGRPTERNWPAGHRAAGRLPGDRVG